MPLPSTLRPLLYICGTGFLIISLLSVYNTHKVDRLLPASVYNIVSSKPKQLPENKPDLFADYLNTQSVDNHPIDELIADARRVQDEVLKSRSYDLTLAATRYRKRRKRHPPPGFDKWMEYALEHDAVIVEEYFDRIYHDLQPFWASDAKVLAESAANWDHVVQVRDGKALPVGDTVGRVAWLDMWTKLVAECAEHLPDVDMPINYMDESRLLVPWTEIDKRLKIAREKEGLIPVKDAIQDYQPGVNRTNITEGLGPETHRPAWLHGLDAPLWNFVAAGCPPDTPSHNVGGLTDFTVAPEFPPADEDASYSQKGYVKNFTASMDPCLQPHLKSLHGSFIEPLSVAITTDLFPLFSGSKFPTNNDILIPGAMYLTDDPFYSGGTSTGPPWDEKTTTLTWRGDATGGRHKAENWRHFQRLRMMEMTNGTAVAGFELNDDTPLTFRMPSPKKYPSAFGERGQISEWLTEHADTGFVRLVCFPADGNCDYLSEYYHPVESKSLAEQYSSKFFADVDGNSFSARYRALLASTSVVIKSTIYAEWHDYRLQPWLHYIPMDNTYQDLYGLLDYFTRDARGDAAAHWIAESGKAWAATVLRREDMLLYTWRLLLEFARICNEDRDKLAYVDDLATGGNY